jgi:hypothetical protein
MSSDRGDLGCVERLANRMSLQRSMRMRGWRREMRRIQEALPNLERAGKGTARVRARMMRMTLEKKTCGYVSAALVNNDSLISVVTEWCFECRQLLLFVPSTAPARYIPPQLRAAQLEERSRGNKQKAEKRMRLEGKAQGLLNK